MIEARHTPSSRAEISLTPRKSLIYVVDDDNDVLRSLRFLLETEAFDVRTFHSGSALLGSSSRHSADCLVVDYKMAGIDGLELAQRLRGIDANTPIVMITGYPDENIAAKASSAGVRKVLLKSNIEENLVECVRNAINPGRAATRPETFSPEHRADRLRKTP